MSGSSVGRKKSAHTMTKLSRCPYSVWAFQQFCMQQPSPQATSTKQCLCLNAEELKQGQINQKTSCGKQKLENTPFSNTYSIFTKIEQLPDANCRATKSLLRAPWLPRNTKLVVECVKQKGCLVRSCGWHVHMYFWGSFKWQSFQLEGKKSQIKTTCVWRKAIK